MQQQNVNSAPAPLGWGIIGSADGYQYSVQGSVEEQLKCAQYWDLPTKIAVVLPSPDSKERIPLYCVAFRKINNVNIISLIQYFSTRQQGSYRSGTFFGSFVEMANSIPTSETAEVLTSALINMSGFQIQNFIDIEKNSYKQNIKNQPFSTPNEELRTIASRLNPLPNLQIKDKKVLFVNCSEGKRDNNVLALILANPYLSRYFENIYFSSSPTICEKFKSVPDVEYHYVNTFKSYLDLLNAQLAEQEIKARYFQTEQGKLLNNLKGLQEENNSYKQGLEKFKISIQNELSKQFTLERESFMQHQEQIIEGKDKEIKELATSLDKMNQEKNAYEHKAKVFDGICQYIYTNVDIGGEQQREIQHLSQQNQLLNANLNQAKQKINDLDIEKRSLSRELDQERNKPIQEDPELLKAIKIYKITTMLFAGLFLLSLIGSVFYFTFNNGSSDIKEQHKKLQEEHNKLKQTNGNLEEQSKELEAKYKTLTNTVKDKDKSIVDLQKFKDKYCQDSKNKKEDVCKEQK